MAKKEWTIIQVPYGGGYSSLNLANTPNTRKAPSALKKEFMRQKIFIADNGIASWDDVLWSEVLWLLRYENTFVRWQMAHRIIHDQSFTSCSGSDKNILFLGGSHTITASTYSGLARAYNSKKSGLIVFDAHPDCCHKADWPIHSDWLRWLIEKNYVLPENVLIIGLRQVEISEKEFLNRLNIKYYNMNSIKDADDFPMNNFSVLRVLDKLRSLTAIYMSIDIDVASGVYAPGTGCPSPGGFTDKELIGLIKKFKNTLPNLKAVDIVEINPLKWWQKKVLRYDATVDLGVKLIKEIIS